MGKIIEIDHDERRVEYPKVKPQHLPAADGWFSVTTIALKRSCSTDKVFRTVERYRGRDGFLDLGTKADQKRAVHRTFGSAQNYCE
jgi:hypothetical protein